MTTYLHKRTQLWTYDFQLNGRRYTDTCKDPTTGEFATSKRGADAIEAMVRAAALKAPKNAEKTINDTDVSVMQPFGAFSTRKKDGRNWANQAVYVRELVKFFEPDSLVIEISEQRVWEYIKFAREQPLMICIGGSRSTAERMAGSGRPLYRPATSGKMRADSTINRYLDCLRETLRIAYSLRDGRGKKLIDAEMPVVPELTEPEHLPRPILDTDLARLIEHAPAHLADALQLARLMGFRKAEIFSLTVDQVNFENLGVWLEAANTKAQRAEFIAASVEAMTLLRRLVDQARDRGVTHLITYPFKRAEKVDGKRIRRYTGSVVIDGKRHLKREGIGVVTEWRPIKDARGAWRSALKAAGLDGQHVFHNTKASFVTAVAHNASAAVTQHLARHKDYRTTERYLKVNNMAARAALNASSVKLVAGEKSRTMVFPAPGRSLTP